jgi:hypothetical protein
MSYCRAAWVQYEEALCDCFLSIEENKRDLKRMSALRYEGNIKDYMTQKTYDNTQLGLKGLAWVAQIALDLPSWFKDCCSMKLARTYDEDDYEVAITVVSLRIRKGKEKLSMRRSLIRQGARRTKVREKRFPSLSLQVIEVIGRSLITRDKRRHGFPTLLSLRKRTSQSGRTITRKKP